MLPENIILQSAGSLSVAVMALLMLILQTLFFFRKPQFTWYAWSAAVSFSALLYSVGIFLEYNTPEGPLNRFSGLLEYTAIICLIQCLYGFTFSYLGIESKRYHPVAGVCHGLILILLWFTNYVVAESFTTRNFIGLESPYIEPALGPLGPVFVLYAAIAGVNAMIVWIKHKRTDPKNRIAFLAGMGFWLLLGIHDGLASLGLPALQYFMEYGFLGFAMVVLWVVFNSYLEIEAEDKYRVITEFANDCILVIQDGKMVFGNPACCDLIGWPLTDSAPRDFLDIMASEDRKTVLKDYDTLLEGGHTPNPNTVRIRRADGEQRFVEIASSLIQYRNRPAVLAIMRDMTERKRAEEALRESEERYRTVLEVNPDPIVVYDIGDRVIYFNPAFERVFGWTLKERLGKKMEMFAHEEDRAETNKMIENVKQGKGFPGFETRRYTKKGDIIDISMSAAIWHDSFGVSVGKVITLRDITEQKKLEFRLQHAQKLESIGIMASGVAHNFRNILNGIAVNSQLLRLKYKEKQPLIRMTEGIDKAIERGAQLVDGLVQFSRKGITERFRLVNLSAAVQETGNLISKSFDKKIDIQIDLSESIPVMGDHSSLRQVIMNLCTNARDAMPDGGKLNIKARQKGAMAEVIVSDTGHGMDKKTLEKCFDPFFTTKAVDKGTGLGLSTSYGIIKEHKGDIHAYSELGKGTTFKIYLPLAFEDPPPEEQTLPELIKGGGQKILIVDDDISMLKPLENLLEDVGYRAVSVSSGKGAIDKYISWKPDAVLMDRNMPEMDGITCLKKIIEQDPTAKFILVSGYDEEGPNGIDYQTRRMISDYITKPIGMSELCQVLAQLFGEYK